MFIQPIFNTVINIKVTQLKITVNKTYYYYYYYTFSILNKSKTGLLKSINFLMLA